MEENHLYYQGPMNKKSTGRPQIALGSSQSSQIPFQDSFTQNSFQNKISDMSGLSENFNEEEYQEQTNNLSST